MNFPLIHVDLVFGFNQEFRLRISEPYDQSQVRKWQIHFDFQGLVVGLYVVGFPISGGICCHTQANCHL